MSYGGYSSYQITQLLLYYTSSLNNGTYDYIEKCSFILDYRSQNAALDRGINRINSIEQ